MKTKLLVLMLLAAGTMMAGTHFGIVVGVGGPPVGVYAPPPPCPGPDYSWVDGYWYWSGPQRYWRPGYWAAPRYFRGEHRGWYDRGYRRDYWRGDHYDRGHDRGFRRDDRRDDRRDFRRDDRRDYRHDNGRRGWRR